MPPAMRYGPTDKRQVQGELKFTVRAGQYEFVERFCPCPDCLTVRLLDLATISVPVRRCTGSPSKANPCVREKLALAKHIRARSPTDRFNKCHQVLWHETL